MNKLMSVMFDDSFEDNISDVLALVYRFAKEANLPIAPVSNEDQAGFIIAEDNLFILNRSNWIHWNGLIHGSLAVIGEVNMDDITPDWPWTEFNDAHLYVLERAYGTKIAVEIADGYEPVERGPFARTAELIGGIHANFTFNADDLNKVVVEPFGNIITTEKGAELQFDRINTYAINHEMMNYYAPVGKNWAEGIQFIADKNASDEFRHYVDHVSDQFSDVIQVMQTALYTRREADLQTLVAYGDLEHEEMLDILHDIVKNFVIDNNDCFWLTPKWR